MPEGLEPGGTKVCAVTMLQIEDPEVCRLADQLARMRGTDLDEALVHALRTELEHERAKRRPDERSEQLADGKPAKGGSSFRTP